NWINSQRKTDNQVNDYGEENNQEKVNGPEEENNKEKVNGHEEKNDQEKVNSHEEENDQEKVNSHKNAIVQKEAIEISDQEKVNGHEKAIDQEEAIDQKKAIEISDNYDDLLIAAANSQVLGILTIIEPFNAISFAIRTTSPISGLISIYSNSFNVDPLTPCGPGDASYPELLQDRFSDISKNYKLVEDNNFIIPVFGLSTICNPSSGPPNFPGFNYSSRHSLLNTAPINLTIINLTKTVEMDSWLENRWIAEVINLEQDSFNEMTIITINFVQVLAFNSICEESINAGDSKLCYPKM
ncbi:2988_t:CDS:2, partial [Racocetra persica]